TRAEIEEIRGVSVSKGALDVLMEAGWVRMRGRRKAPGRPITYGTTTAFLVELDRRDPWRRGVEGRARRPDGGGLGAHAGAPEGAGPAHHLRHDHRVSGRIRSQRDRRPAGPRRAKGRRIVRREIAGRLRPSPAGRRAGLEGGRGSARGRLPARRGLPARGRLAA